MNSLRTSTGTTAAVLLLVAGLGLSGCVSSSQNRYTSRDVGHSATVDFGTVISTRQVEIEAQRTGIGSMAGGAAGGLAGSAIGAGGGNLAAIVGGIVIGAIVGAVAEQAIADHTGIEYIITLANGQTMTIVQETARDERVFNPGERVMVQDGGSYQRVLSAQQLPTEITRPRDIRVRD
ncbi:outer membrane lipoprotein SlyB [uncultured Gammaproteobacteria bacterium]